VSETTNYIVGDEPIELNAGKRTLSVRVDTPAIAHPGGPTSISSSQPDAPLCARPPSHAPEHPAGTAVRFEPGE